ncbi:MAG TPA: glycosyltransferase [Gaiellaceae bacterium]|nr:glycosyltransferase [Gaiellaceae bacterium]
MKAPKILAVASAVDLDFRYGCTPAWWQLWKGLYEAGCDLIVTPYRGRPVDAPWWRTEPNPCYREAELFAGARDAVAKLKRDTHLRRAEDQPPDSASDKLVRRTIWSLVTPRWRRHLERILERERDVDAVIVFTVPMSHFRGIPTALRERFELPIVYYDGDVPMSLPEFGGMDTGFNIYHGADPSEYDLVVSNSEGGLGRLRELGALRAEAVFWGADPELFAPLPVAKEHDVFFYGYGDKFRREWMTALVGEPSRQLPEVDFALGGRDFRADIGRARTIGDVPFNAFNRAISASRINLNITRRSHATVTASSTSRPFELAAAGAAIVSNPVEGIERWFEPGRELLVVQDAAEAEQVYQELLADPGARDELGRRARERALDEHTYVARARRLLELIGLRVPQTVELARG